MPLSDEVVDMLWIDVQLSEFREDTLISLTPEMLRSLLEAYELAGVAQTRIDELASEVNDLTKDNKQLRAAVNGAQVALRKVPA